MSKKNKRKNESPSPNVEVKEIITVQDAPLKEEPIKKSAEKPFEKPSFGLDGLCGHIRKRRGKRCLRNFCKIQRALRQRDSRLYKNRRTARQSGCIRHSRTREPFYRFCRRRFFQYYRSSRRQDLSRFEKKRCFAGVDEGLDISNEVCHPERRKRMLSKPKDIGDNTSKSN